MSFASRSKFGNMVGTVFLIIYFVGHILFNIFWPKFIKKEDTQDKISFTDKKTMRKLGFIFPTVAHIFALLSVSFYYDDIKDSTKEVYDNFNECQNSLNRLIEEIKSCNKKISNNKNKIDKCKNIILSETGAKASKYSFDEYCFANSKLFI